MKSAGIQQEQYRYEVYLKNAGFILTRGRAGVFKAAMETHGHFTAEDIVKLCVLHKPKISRATVYRSLHEMMEAGVVRGTAFGEKHQVFEHVYDEIPHHHARCIHCHQLFEFKDKGEDVRYRPILAKMGFRILGHEMHFYGVCKDCQEEL